MKSKRLPAAKPDGESQSFLSIPNMTSQAASMARKASSAIADIDRILKKPPRLRRSPTGGCCGETDPCKRWKECYDCNTCISSMGDTRTEEE